MGTMCGGAAAIAAIQGEELHQRKTVSVPYDASSPTAVAKAGLAATRLQAWFRAFKVARYM